jgi:hypothetical protein
MKEETEIFEFIKMTEKRGTEVKGFMEVTDKNLAVTNSVITRQTGKLEEYNTVIKGWEAGFNYVTTELIEVKIRQSKCEWKRETWEEEARKNNLIISGRDEKIENDTRTNRR